LLDLREDFVCLVAAWVPLYRLPSCVCLLSLLLDLPSEFFIAGLLDLFRVCPTVERVSFETEV
jgi:hypothetical protein